MQFSNRVAASMPSAATDAAGSSLVRMSARSIGSKR
jgi:hypothetical protein